jgi:uncharacterized damage-inducible protein DinB
VTTLNLIIHYHQTSKTITMKIIPLLQQEFKHEAQTTRKFINLIPEDKFNWKPHEKSMSMKDLAVHIAEITAWPQMALNTEEMDFADGYEPTPVNSPEELLTLFEESATKGKNALEDAEEEDLEPKWTMRDGDQVLMVMNKYEVIRHSLNQTTHHRAQLGVYFRQLDIAVPGSYGPSADDQSF